MTLLSSSHRSIIKVFPFSLTLQGMNKIEYFFNAREKNIFSSGYTGVEKSFQTEFLNFHFWILWSYGWIMGGKLLWLKYIYIYIPEFICERDSSGERMNELSFRCFSVLPSMRLLRDPTTISSVHPSSESTLSSNVLFTPSSLFHPKISLLWHALIFPVYMAPKWLFRNSFCGRHDTLGLSY